MIDIQVTSPDLDRLVAMWPQYPGVVDRELRRAMTESVLTVEATAKQLAPVGATAILSSGIYHEIEGGEGELRGIVATGPASPYAVAVEGGSRPHFPPVAALRPWCRSVLGDERAAWPVAIAISRRGTRPQRFMARTIEQEQGRIDAFFAAAASRAAAAIGRQ